MISENYNNEENWKCNIIDKEARPVKVIFDNASIEDNKDDTFTIAIKNTMSPINIEVPDKKYILQHTKHGYRCISHHPHYIMTDWVKTKKQALLDGDNAINRYYDKIERDNKNDEH